MAFSTNSDTGQQVFGTSAGTTTTRSVLQGQINSLAQRVADLEEEVGAISTAVWTFADLQTAITNEQALVEFYAHITPTAAITIPVGMHIDFRGFTLVDGGYSVTFYGTTNMDRGQKFSGFTAGDIKGTFGHGLIYPEWWGLAGSDVDDGQHDLAINAAIQAIPISTLGVGCTVLLGAGFYYVSAPLDMSGTYGTLEGAGPFQTHVFATSTWTADWLYTSVWDTVVGGNHAAMVYIGGNVPGGSTYCSKVKNMRLRVYSAAVANPTRHISGISAKWGIEENCEIDDVLVAWANGCHIGFPDHSYHVGTTAVATAVLTGAAVTSATIVTAGTGYTQGTTTVEFIGGGGSGATGTVTVTAGAITAINITAGGSGYTTAPTVVFLDYIATVINGLRIGKVWLLSPVQRDGFAMYFPDNTGNCTVNEASIDVRLTDDNDDGFDWMSVAIRAAGKLRVGTLHIEGTCIGVYIPPSAVPSSAIVIDSMDVNHMMNEVAAPVHFEDIIHHVISGVATYNAGTETLLTVDTSAGLAVGQVVALSSVNGTNAAGYNTVHIVTAVPDATHFAINKAWVAEGASPTTAGDVVWNAAPTGNTDYDGYSCAVLIGSMDAGVFHGFNYTSSVTINGLKSFGQCSYLLRDRVYSHEVSCWGWGQFPNNGTLAMAHYSRGNAYVNATTAPYAGVSDYYTLDQAMATPTDRIYFTGPVF
jgi:hypothetical protein